MNKNPTVEEIVKKWLKDNGYDGLFDGDNNCACGLDDLMPCGEYYHRCEAGYKVPCDGSCEYGKCDFHIAREKYIEEKTE